jgi:hypothetical protein
MSYNYERHKTTKELLLFDEIEIAPRVGVRHPELTNADISSAWANALVVIERSGVSLPDAVLVAIGSDSNDRLIEMVGAVRENGTIYIFHAMTPPSHKTFQEVGLTDKRRAYEHNN